MALDPELLPEAWWDVSKALVMGDGVLGSEEQNEFRLQGGSGS